MTLEMAEGGDTCQPADQIEDIEDMMGGGGGGGGEDSLLLPRERFNNRREVTLRPKKRSRKSEIVASEGPATNGGEDVQVFYDAVCFIIVRKLWRMGFFMAWNCVKLNFDPFNHTGLTHIAPPTSFGARD
jgi:hypothetical protein